MEDASAFPLDRSNVASHPSGELLEPGDGVLGVPLPVRREGDRWLIPAELSSGEYVVRILLQIPEGDAYYSFRILAEP